MWYEVIHVVLAKKEVCGQHGLHSFVKCFEKSDCIL